MIILVLFVDDVIVLCIWYDAPCIAVWRMGHTSPKHDTVMVVQVKTHV